MNRIIIISVVWGSGSRAECRLVSRCEGWIFRGLEYQWNMRPQRQSVDSVHNNTALSGQLRTVDVLSFILPCLVLSRRGDVYVAALSTVRVRRVSAQSSAI